MTKNKTVDEKKYFFEKHDRDSDRITIDYLRFTAGNVAAHHMQYYVPDYVIDASDLSEDQKIEFKRLISDMFKWIVVFIGCTEQLAANRSVVNKSENNISDSEMIKKIDDKIRAIVEKMKEIGSQASDLGWSMEISDLEK